MVQLKVHDALLVGKALMQAPEVRGLNPQEQKVVTATIALLRGDKNATIDTQNINAYQLAVKIKNQSGKEVNSGLGQFLLNILSYFGLIDTSDHVGKVVKDFKRDFDVTLQGLAGKQTKLNREMKEAKVACHTALKYNLQFAYKMKEALLAMPLNKSTDINTFRTAFGQLRSSFQNMLSSYVTNGNQDGVDAITPYVSFLNKFYKTFLVEGNPLRQREMMRDYSIMFSATSTTIENLEINIKVTEATHKVRQAFLDSAQVFLPKLENVILI